MKYVKDIVVIGTITLGLTTSIKAQVPSDEFPAFAGDWLQWALSIPNSVNPTVDPTGAQCMVGQTGSIWFLAGNGSHRFCSIPAGATLFFPVINFYNFNTPSCGQNGNMTAQQLLDVIQPAINNINSVSVTVDGNEIDKTLLRLVVSAPFEVAVPPENLFGSEACGKKGPLLPGIYSPAVTGGEYASLPPLRPGKHTLHFHGVSGDAVQDVTYDLTVVSVSLK